MRLDNIECKVFREGWLIASFMIYSKGKYVGDKELDIYAGSYKAELLAKMETENYCPVERFGNILVMHSIEESVECFNLCTLASTFAGLAREEEKHAGEREYYQGLATGYKLASIQIAKEYIALNRKEMTHVARSKERGQDECLM